MYLALVAVLTASLLQLGAFSVKLKLLTLAVQVLAVLMLSTLTLILWRSYRA
jgi:hypothetical protein